MKQTFLMMILLVTGTVGPFISGPFIGVAVYYLFAVLRPQAIWGWALPSIGWSFYVALATIITTMVYYPRGWYGKRFTGAHLAVFCFALWITLSNFAALNPVLSSRWYWEYFKIFVMFFCSSLVVHKFSEVRTLYKIAMFALGYIAYEMNLLYLVDRRMDIYFLGFADWDNNGAGLMLAMGIPMAYFMWQSTTQWWRWCFLAMLIVMLHAVLLSFSRGAMAALVLTFPLLIVRSKQRRTMIAFVLCLAFAIPLLAGPEIRARFFSTGEYQQDRSAQSRVEGWRAAWAMAKDYPLFGVGLRNSDFLSFQYGADVEGRTIHSQYFQILADSGFPALAFYVLTIFGTWRALRWTQRRCSHATDEDNKLAYNIASGIEGALAVFCVGALFLSLQIFELPYLLILMALKLRLAVSQELAQDKTSLAMNIAGHTGLIGKPLGAQPTSAAMNR
jgi:probable O-glycosylation ligase (exosortase A-associated)